MNMKTSILWRKPRIFSGNVTFSFQQKMLYILKAINVKGILENRNAAMKDRRSNEGICFIIILLGLNFCCLEDVAAWRKKEGVPFFEKSIIMDVKSQ